MTVTIDDIQRAHRRIVPSIHCTPIMRSSQLDQMLGCELWFKADNLQKVGAFKARGACNAIYCLDKQKLRQGVITHSSGNHGAALAWAASLRGASCTVVVPENAPQVKKDAVKHYGADMVLCESSMAARESTVAELINRQGGLMVHPYDSEVIIAGQGTAALELLEQLDRPVDIVMTPVGGGGLLAGTAVAVKGLGDALVLGTEPQAANDAWQGYYSGIRVESFSPKTLADGLRATVGMRNFEIMRNHVDDILLTSEKRIVEAMRLIWSRLKILVEPSAAVPLAAIMDQPQEFQGKRVAVILTGGNVDLDRLLW